MQKAQGEPSLLRASRDASSGKCNRNQREQQITEGWVINAQARRGAAEDESQRVKKP